MNERKPCPAVLHPAAMVSFGEEVVEYALGRARDQLLVLPHDGRLGASDRYLGAATPKGRAKTNADFGVIKSGDR